MTTAMKTAFKRIKQNLVAVATPPSKSMNGIRAPHKALIMPPQKKASAADNILSTLKAETPQRAEASAPEMMLKGDAQEIEFKALESGDTTQADARPSIESDRSYGVSSPLVKMIFASGELISAATVPSTAPLTGMLTVSTGTATVKYLSNSKVLVEQGHLTVRDGEALIIASKPTHVKIADAIVTVNPGAIALVSKDDRVVKVRSLYERWTGTIQVFLGKRESKLNAGQELMLGPEGDSVLRSMSQDKVGRRRVKNVDLVSGDSIIRSEVSLVSLFGRNTLMKQIHASKNVDDQDIKEKIVKMAACLSVVTSSHGPFTSTPSNGLKYTQEKPEVEIESIPAI